MANLSCPYCGGLALLKDSSVVYGISYGKIYVCINYPGCDSYVGVHKKNNKPLGTLAKPYLRELRKECHSKFDTLWKENESYNERSKARKKAYKWLSGTMGLSKKKAHIAMFNEEQCLELLQYLDI